MRPARPRAHADDRAPIIGQRPEQPTERLPLGDALRHAAQAPRCSPTAAAAAARSSSRRHTASRSRSTSSQSHGIAPSRGGRSQHRQQPFAGARQTATSRCRSATSHDRGDFLVREPFDFAQHHHFAEVRRQLSSAARTRATVCCCSSRASGSSAVVGRIAAACVQRCDCASRRAARRGCTTCSARSRTARRGVVAAKRREEAHRPHAGVLHHIFGLRIVSGQPSRVIEGRVQMGQDRLLERPRGITSVKTSRAGFYSRE